MVPEGIILFHTVILFLGACTKPPRLSLITEYMEMGSLYYLIHASGLKKKLSWQRRLKMLCDICRFTLNCKFWFFFIGMLQFRTFGTLNLTDWSKQERKLEGERSWGSIVGLKYLLPLLYSLLCVLTSVYLIQGTNDHPSDESRAPWSEKRKLPCEQALDGQDLRFRAFQGTDHEANQRFVFSWNPRMDGSRAYPERALYWEMRHF